MVVKTILTVTLLPGNPNYLLLLLYTDPGSGALLWQLLVAAFLGGAFYARVLIRQLKTRLASVRRSGSSYQSVIIDQRSSRAIKAIK